MSQRAPSADRQKVLVTGGTGFVGSHLVRLLLERGENTVIATGVSGSAPYLEDVRGKIGVERADTGNFDSVLRLVQTHQPKTIYHLGAMLAPSCDSDPEAGIRTNALGTYYVLEAARLFGVQQVIFASSMSVFTGVYSNEPVLNDYSLTRPDFVYGAAKLFSENIGLFFRREYGFDYRGVRLPNVIGPGAKTHGYLEYFNKAIEESAKGAPYSVYVAPHVRIPILHVDDAARAFVELAHAPASQRRQSTTSFLAQPRTRPPRSSSTPSAPRSRGRGSPSRSTSAYRRWSRA